jgi:hypothetical protein
MLHEGLYQKLVGDSGVNAIVNGRVYFQLQPKGTSVPSVVIQQATSEDVYHTKGASGFRFVGVQFDSYGANYTQAVQTSNAVRVLLQSFKGVLPDGTSVDGSVVRRDVDLPYEQGPGERGFVYRRMLTIEFQVAE